MSGVRSRRRPVGGGVVPRPARRSQRAAWTSLVVFAATAVTACAGATADRAADLPPLLDVDQLGNGWVASDPGDVALLPGTVAPPCPFDGEIPDVEVAAADSMEFGDQQRGLGINHTVVAVGGDAEMADAVLATWSSMDCSGSDAVQRPVDGLPDGVFGVELDTVDSDFTQAVLIRVEGPTMSFLVVTGEGDVTIDVARRLAPLI